MAGVREEFALAVESLANARALILACLVLMTLGSAAGYAFTDLSGEHSSRGESEAFTAPTLESILASNLSVALSLVSGSLLLGVPTVVTLLYNGYVLGALATNAVAEGELAVMLALLAPHGVLELPAFWILGSCGLRIPIELIRHLRGERETVLTRTEIAELCRLIAVALGLIVAAAAVECTVTLALAERIGSA